MKSTSWYSEIAHSRMICAESHQRKKEDNSLRNLPVNLIALSQNICREDAFLEHLELSTFKRYTGRNKVTKTYDPVLHRDEGKYTLCFYTLIPLLPFTFICLTPPPPGKAYQTIFKVHSYVLLTFMAPPSQWHRSIPESHRLMLFSSTVTHHPKYVNCLSFKCPRNICYSSRCLGGQTAAALTLRSWWVSPAEQGWWNSLPRAACMEVLPSQRNGWKMPRVLNCDFAGSLNLGCILSSVRAILENNSTLFQKS